VGGAVHVVRELAPALVLEPGQAVGSRPYLEFLGAVEAGGLDWRAARAGDTLTLDGVTLAVLHPSADWMAGQLSPNENSVVLRVSYGCFDALLAGDVGAPVEWALRGTRVEADLLKVGHHGSAGGTTDAWLDTVRPKAAVVSVGRTNRYGHPSSAVVRRLAARQIPLWRTDRGGTVTIETEGRYLTLAQGEPRTLGEGIRCWILRLLRSSDSSSIRRSCIRKPPVSLPACSTTSPLRRR
jgi:competence protein ComEC